MNPKNDFVKSLTVEQLKAIWAPGEQGEDLEGRRSVLARPARSSSTRPDNDSGTFEFFTEAIVGKAKSQRDDVQQSSDDNTLVNGVAGDADGLGYFGYAYLRGQQGQAPGRGRPERRRRQARAAQPRRRSSTRPTLRCRGRCSST